MSAFCRLSLMVAICGMLQACQAGGPGLPGAADDAPTANAVAGDPIEVTALEDPATLPDPAAVAEPAAEGEPLPVAAGPDGTSPAAADPEAAPGPEAEPEPAVPEVEMPPEAATEPGEPKSEAQLACEKKKGRWVSVGTGQSRTCVFETRDSGKQCRVGSDCEEACLARSMTCAPFKPLWGCNDIVQDNGMRVTQCIE